MDQKQADAQLSRSNSIQGSPAAGAVTEAPRGFDKSKYPFDIDAEGRAKGFKLLSFWSSPHMRAFHLSWICFFLSFCAAFALASFVPVIRQNLNLKRVDLGNAGVSSVIGAVATRILIGLWCDIKGPRYGLAMVLFCIAPALFCSSLINDANGLIGIRFLIGAGLCCFVCCQFWCGSMFNGQLVGSVNATAAGWGNLGGGVIQLIMPLIYEGIKASGVVGFSAWRWAMFLPGAAFILAGLAVMLLAVDSPNGDYRDIKKTMNKDDNPKQTFLVGFCNYRTWIMTLNYGYCFGVELTINNIIVEYLFDQFGLSLSIAGILGSLFGLMNIFCRSLGGILSDIAGKYYGMRGRIWMYYILQTMVGVFSIILGKVDYSLGATVAVMVTFSVWVQAAEGASFGVVPFVSRRSYGVVAGFVGAGGNAGAAITQALFFSVNPGIPEFSKQDGLQWMGVMVLGVTTTLAFMHWPMWGGMFTAPDPEATEEDYFIKEWTAEEVAEGKHHMAMLFAKESRSQRGTRSQNGKYLTDSSKSLELPVGK